MAALCTLYRCHINFRPIRSTDGLRCDVHHRGIYNDAYFKSENIAQEHEAPIEFAEGPPTERQYLDNKGAVGESSRLIRRTDREVINEQRCNVPINFVALFYQRPMPINIHSLAGLYNINYLL